jgi:hypothetical protein
MPPSATPVALTPLAPGMARIVFYRDIDYYAPSTVETISLNGKPVGVLPRGDAFYRDVTPGTYDVTFAPTRPDPHQFKTITPGAGNVFYVKLIGLHETDCSGSTGSFGGCDISGFTSELVDPASAQRELTGLSLVRG